MNPNPPLAGGAETDQDRDSRTWRKGTIAWSLLVIAVHAIPRAGLVQIPGGEDFVNSTIYDKIAHASMFGVLGFLGARGFPTRRLGFLAFGVALGGLLEATQALLVPGRSASVEDWFFDGVGLTLGLVISRGIRKP